MKRLLLTSCLAVVATTLAAAPLNIVEVGAPAINCVFNTNCTSIVNDTTSPFTLPNTTGTGVLQTRTFMGETGSLAQGLFGYEYRIDLTGLTANTNAQPCRTNEIRCETNRVVTTSNVLVCVTNQLPASNRVVCVTNRLPATNFVFFFTNTIPPTNFVRCVPLPSGGVVCFTNAFAGTNIVFAFTNRLAGSNVVTCTNIVIPGANVVSCTNNRVRFTNTTVRCTTNEIACPGSAPCIDTLRLHFPALANFDVTGTNGSNAQVYVVTSGGLGSAGPTSADRDGSIITLHFDTPICPGETSFYIGLVSSNAPTATPAVLGLTTDSNIVAGARTPRLTGPRITCDFSALRTAIAGLALSDILAPNDKARAGRRGALLNNVDAAIQAADRGDLEGVLEALGMIANKTGNKGNPWVNPSTGRRIGAILEPILDCLERFHPDDDRHGDHDDRDDHHGKR